MNMSSGISSLRYLWRRHLTFGVAGSYHQNDAVAEIHGSFDGCLGRSFSALPYEADEWSRPLKIVISRPARMTDESHASLCLNSACI